MARPRILLLCVCLIAGNAAVLPAGAPADKDLEGISVAELFPGARFDPGIPTQAKLLGLEPGARPLRHPELIRVVDVVGHRLLSSRSWVVRGFRFAESGIRRAPGENRVHAENRGTVDSTIEE